MCTLGSLILFDSGLRKPFYREIIGSKSGSMFAIKSHLYLLVTFWPICQIKGYHKGVNSMWCILLLLLLLLCTDYF